MTAPEITTQKPLEPALPEALPLISLSGTILLPRMRLPLNIFEPHLLTTVEYALAHGRMLAVLQPQSLQEGETSNYAVGCAGRIVHFSETDDGRYLITLLGIARFKTQKEKEAANGCKLVEVSWQNYLGDLSEESDAPINRTRLVSAVKVYFRANNIGVDWDILHNTTDEELVSSLAMVAPLATNEKQALLEAPTLQDRAQTLVALLEMASLNQDNQDGPKH